MPRQQQTPLAEGSEFFIGSDDEFSLSGGRPAPLEELRPQQLGVVRAACPRITGPSLSLAVLGGGSEAVDSSCRKRGRGGGGEDGQDRGQDPPRRRSQCRGLCGLATAGEQSSLLGRQEEWVVHSSGGSGGAVLRRDLCVCSGE